MPFKKTSKGNYKSPSGKKFTEKQVRAYYATDGFKKPSKGTKVPKKGKDPFQEDAMDEFHGKPKKASTPKGKKSRRY